MIYTANITTVKDTPRTSPKKTPLHVTKGLVYKVEFYFPSGSAGLMGVAVFDGLFQVWPSTLDQFFTGDGVVFGFDDVYLKEVEPYQFDVHTYNEDDTYGHSVTVHIGLVSKDIFMARFLPHMTYKYFEELLGKMAAVQAAAAAAQKQERARTPYEIVFGE